MKSRYKIIILGCMLYGFPLSGADLLEPILTPIVLAVADYVHEVCTNSSIGNNTIEGVDAWSGAVVAAGTVGVALICAVKQREKNRQNKAEHLRAGQEGRAACFEAAAAERAARAAREPGFWEKINKGLSELPKSRYEYKAVYINRGAGPSWEVGYKLS